VQRDFHYYATAYLAHETGFSRDDAVTIATACQFVDDSDLTAHTGLRCWSKQVQHEIYMPFHFLPSAIGDFIVRPAGGISLDLLHDALAETDAKLRLYRVGVALHTLADTFSHQGFSGRENSENDVIDPQVLEGNEWKRPFLETAESVAAPLIGHAQAGELPDEPWREWRYQTKDGRKFDRDNQARCHIAAELIYEELLSEDMHNNFAAISGRLSRIFRLSGSIDYRCHAWRKEILYIDWYDWRGIDHDRFRRAAILQRDRVIKTYQLED
jgi:hypothetical protein